MKNVLFVMVASGLFLANSAFADDINVLKASCSASDIHACYGVAVSYRQGLLGVRKNTATAIEYLALSCDGGIAAGCINLGVMYFEGEGVKPDKQKAAASYDKACDRGDAKGCFTLGLLYEYGEGVKQDTLQAAALYAKVCDGGHAEGCCNLGAMYFNGEGVRQDSAKALSLYAKACDLKLARGCNAHALLKNID